MVGADAALAGEAFSGTGVDKLAEAKAAAAGTSSRHLVPEYYLKSLSDLNKQTQGSNSDELIAIMALVAVTISLVPLEPVSREPRLLCLSCACVLPVSVCRASVSLLSLSQKLGKEAECGND